MDPDRIGPYEIRQKLGAGGMGSVYLGRHVETGQLVAVKLLTASLAREPGFVERFNREIDAMRKLKNPHIVELFENGVEGESYYYAMEHVEGETLMGLMRREKRIPWQKALDIAVQICQALKAAHDAGIIHRDLKPSNLLVTPEGVVKLTDFGVAQVFASSRLTVTGGIIGTAEYMSPEQAQGKRAGKQSDLYSLGAVLYAMVTGRTPFSGSTAVEVIQKHKFGLFDRPKMYVPDIPVRVDDTICRLLEKNPEKRFPDALVLLRHLEQIVALEEYAATGVTLAGELPDDESGATRAVTDDEPASSRHSPGPATIMKTLIRAELDDAKGGVLSTLFNNTYVLVGLLCLVVAGGFWWFKSGSTTPQELFDQGTALLENEPGPEWLRARRDYFDKLLEIDPDTWRERVDPLLKKIELYELSRPGRSARPSKAEPPKSEAERLLQLALHYKQIGETARAERILWALHDLLAGDEDETRLYELTGQLLDELGGNAAAADNRDRMLSAALDRAAKHVEAGSPAEARKIWSGLIELYGDDPSATKFVDEAREALEKSGAGN
jgi:serine/threonine protein kinase